MTYSSEITKFRIKYICPNSGDEEEYEFSMNDLYHETQWDGHAVPITSIYIENCQCNEKHEIILHKL